MEHTIEAQMTAYFAEKNIPRRYQILKAIMFQCPPNAKDFFLRAFKKERYLDMKLTALRGYAYYACEAEVAQLSEKMMELLKKRAQSTPYNYQEYEIMRSAFLLPYLEKKYQYACLHALSNQVEAQYNCMPDVFKNIFSCDENGNSYPIRDPEEVKQSMQAFFEKRDPE